MSEDFERQWQAWNKLAGQWEELMQTLRAETRRASTIDVYLRAARRTTGARRGMLDMAPLAARPDYRPEIAREAGRLVGIFSQEINRLKRVIEREKPVVRPVKDQFGSCRPELRTLPPTPAEACHELEPGST